MQINLETMFYKLGRFCATRKYVTLVLVSLLTVVFSYFALQIEIKLGVLSLLEEKDPELIKVQYANENFGGMTYTFISVTARTLNDAKTYADLLADTIRENDMVLRVVHKFDMDALMAYGFLFLEAPEINDFKDFVKENQQDLINIFKDVHTAGFLTGFNHMIERQIIEKDEIANGFEVQDLLDSFNNFLIGMGASFENREKAGNYKLKRELRNLFIPVFSKDDSVFEDDYMLSNDKRSVLLLVMPVEAGGDMVMIDQFMTYLNTAAAKIAAGAPGRTFRIAGNAAVMKDEYEAIRRDAKLSMIVTFILVLIIFFVFFRKLSDLLLISICLIFGILWAFGITYLYIGFLGITTTFFSAILIGLGIDFAIHLMARYSEYRSDGKEVVEAVALAMAGSGPGILIGSATTASAFFVMMVCRFKGISQLGFVAGAGVLSLTVIMFTLLPSLISIRDSSTAIHSRRHFKPMRELSVFSDLAFFAVRHRWPAFFLIFLLTVAMTLAAVRIEFNYDFRSLEPRGSKAIKANHDMETEFGRSVDYSLVFADSIEQSRELAKILKTKASVAEIHEISQYIPVYQSEKAALIKTIAPFLVPIVVEKGPVPGESVTQKDMAQLAFSLRESKRMFLAVKQIAILDGYLDIEKKCTEIMARALTLAENIERGRWEYMENVSYHQQCLSAELKNLLATLKEAARANPLDIDQLPQIIRDNYIGRDGRFLVYAYSEGDIWNQNRLEQITGDLRSVSPDSTSSGIVFLDLVNKIKKDFRFAVGLSLLIVFILVVASFRRLTTGIIVLIPLVLGSLWMVGTMALLGLKFNLVNVAVIPLIIGIGIDDGVHLIHRYRTEQGDRIRMSIQHTGRAIFLTSITTMAGFGSLGLASYTAIATFGWVLLIGVFYCMLTSIIFLPVLLGILENLKIEI